MALNPQQFEDSLGLLFDEDLDWQDKDRLTESMAAFQNLAMHFIESRAKWLLGSVAFDPIKMELMLRRFYRDAFGVSDFHKFLTAKVSDGTLSDALKEEIVKRLQRLSIRINSDLPKKTRVAAAFSLWFCTMRPLYMVDEAAACGDNVWRLEATMNFWMALNYLMQFGTIQIGVPGDVDDFQARMDRIVYDFNFRDLNLSSLEMLYASVFRPERAGPR